MRFMTLSLLGASLLIVSLAPVPLVAQPPQNEPTSMEQRPEPARDVAETNDEARSRRWTIALNGLLVVVGAFTAGFVGWQALESRRVANATIQQVKLATTPRIYIDGVTVTNFSPNKEPVFFLRLVNAGPVQAENVKVFVEIAHSRGGTSPAQANSILVPASGSRNYDFRGSFVLPSNLEEIDAWNLVVKGTVTHNDRPIEFCYKYNPWVGERPDGVPLFVPCDFDHRRNVAVTVGAGKLAMSGSLTTKVIRAAPKQTDTE